ncbi:hypothetical protein BBP40_003633 [Aspergillus hancockii]|nr:hypothetical protein BBP40_003633 [Aspergillus hancockii]
MTPLNNGNEKPGKCYCNINSPTISPHKHGTGALGYGQEQAMEIEITGGEIKLGSRAPRAKALALFPTSIQTGIMGGGDFTRPNGGQMKLKVSGW